MDGGQRAGTQSGGEAQLDSSARGWPAASCPRLDGRDPRKDTCESKQVISMSALFVICY